MNSNSGKDDLIYMATDDYYDQYDATGKTKFSQKRFKEKLLKISDIPLKEQEQILRINIEDWMDKFVQIYDITVFGFKYTKE